MKTVKRYAVIAAFVVAFLAWVAFVFVVLCVVWWWLNLTP